jgi:hypothetical protein
LLQALKGLRFDHSAHLRQHPNKAAGFGVVEFLGTGGTIDACRLGDQSREGIW